MQLEEYPSVSLHNVAETVPAEWDDGGRRLCRLPESVGAGLNDGARERVRHPTGSEIRFVPGSEEEAIEVTLSSPEQSEIRTYWGSFQPWEPTAIGPEPETLAFSVPDRLKDLATTEDTGRFDPRVCRIVFDRHQPIAVHRVSGNCRPPSGDELPDRRYLAYGTSITEGAAASVPTTDYVTHAARNCGYDALNLGCSGSAYCEAAMADHIADRDDWDVATLELSVNMALSGGFSPSEFRERAAGFVDAIAAAHPEKPIACVTLLPYFDDVTEPGDSEHAEGYREAVRSIVDDSSHDNLSVIEGPDLMPVSGLAADLLHPGDYGMQRIGENVADRLQR